MSDLAEIILLIEVHHHKHPDHGINCACMDRHIQALRRLFETKYPEVQRRVDYVLQAALRR